MEKRAEAHHVDYRMITPMSRPTFTFSSSFGKRLATINPDYFEALFQHVYRRIEPQMAVNDARGLRLMKVRGWLPTPLPSRTGRAVFPHPALHPVSPPGAGPRLPPDR